VSNRDRRSGPTRKTFPIIRRLPCGLAVGFLQKSLETSLLARLCSTSLFCAEERQTTATRRAQRRAFEPVSYSARTALRALCAAVRQRRALPVCRDLQFADRRAAPRHRNRNGSSRCRPRIARGVRVRRLPINGLVPAWNRSAAIHQERVLQVRLRKILSHATRSVSTDERCSCAFNAGDTTTMVRAGLQQTPPSWLGDCASATTITRGRPSFTDRGRGSLSALHAVRNACRRQIRATAPTNHRARIVRNSHCCGGPKMRQRFSASRPS